MLQVLWMVAVFKTMLYCHRPWSRCTRRFEEFVKKSLVYWEVSQKREGRFGFWSASRRCKTLAVPCSKTWRFQSIERGYIWRCV